MPIRKELHRRKRYFPQKYFQKVEVQLDDGTFVLRDVEVKPVELDVNMYNDVDECVKNGVNLDLKPSIALTTETRENIAEAIEKETTTSDEE